MSEDEIDNSSDSMNQIAKLTLGMATFMLFLLILVPFTVSSASFDDIFPYLIYSLFLTSIGILIGISMSWLLNNNEKLNKEVTNVIITKNYPYCLQQKKL